MLRKIKNIVTTFIILFLISSFCFLAGCSDDKYTDAARSEAIAILEDNNIDYTEVEIIYSSDFTYDNEKFKFYDLIVDLDSEYGHDYAYMFNILKTIENSSYSLEAYSKRNIVFQEYVRCDGVEYLIDSINEFVLRIDGDYSWEYNSIAEKKGVNLTKDEKEAICQEIESLYNYYDKQEGSYSGDKYSDTIFIKLSARYSISIEDLNMIWAFRYVN